MKLKIIQTEKGQVYVDEKLRAKKGYNFNTALNRIEYLECDYEQFTCESMFCLLIVATSFRLTKDVPMVIEISVEEMACIDLGYDYKYIDSFKQDYYGDIYTELRHWIDGYNYKAAQSQSKEYTLQQLRLAISGGLSIGYSNRFDIDNKEKEIENIINSIKLKTIGLPTENENKLKSQYSKEHRGLIIKLDKA